MLRQGFIAAALMLSACATEATTATDARSDRDCFRSSQVNGYNVIDNHNVRISTGASRDYILSTTWNVRDLDWTHSIGIRSRTGLICTGNGLGVDVIGGDPRRTYPITSITRAPETTATQG